LLALPSASLPTCFSLFFSRVQFLLLFWLTLLFYSPYSPLDHPLTL
jgi:hypothetical protein